jgi:DNA-binding MarR family transcriptional regulator
LVTLSHQGSINLATLAALLEVKPSAAGRMVDRLVGAELIDRCAHPTSRRELLVVLSPRGRKVVREVMVRRRKEIAEIVENMPTADRRGLARGLIAFTTAGGEPSVLIDGEP